MCRVTVQSQSLVPHATAAGATDAAPSALYTWPRRLEAELDARPMPLRTDVCMPRVHHALPHPDASLRGLPHLLSCFGLGSPAASDKPPLARTART
jgi:hypothetical protein